MKRVVRIVAFVLFFFSLSCLSWSVSRSIPLLGAVIGVSSDVLGHAPEVVGVVVLVASLVLLVSSSGMKPLSLKDQKFLERVKRDLKNRPQSPAKDSSRSLDEVLAEEKGTVFDSREELMKPQYLVLPDTNALISLVNKRKNEKVLTLSLHESFPRDYGMVLLESVVSEVEKGMKKHGFQTYMSYDNPVIKYLLTRKYFSPYRDRPFSSFFQQYSLKQRDVPVTPKMQQLLTESWERYAALHPRAKPLGTIFRSQYHHPEMMEKADAHLVAAGVWRSMYHAGNGRPSRTIIVSNDEHIKGMVYGLPEKYKSSLVVVSSFRELLEKYGHPSR